MFGLLVLRLRCGERKEVEILVLRHELAIARRSPGGRGRVRLIARCLPRWAYSWGRRCNAARTQPGTSSHGKWPAAGTTVKNASGEISALARAA